ncbi:MAG: PEP-CTERM sorting domain-containing protein [Cyanobacteria bacterium P01_H01_bin.35]
MLKNTLSTAAATIAIVASASLPAAATSDLTDLIGSAEPPARVPEPSTILGTLAVGGIGLLTAKKKGAQSNEEQK